jgi:preprotein translocase subunit SecA
MNFNKIYTQFKSQKALVAANRIVSKVGGFNVSPDSLSDAELAQTFLALKKEPLAQRTPKGFALVREASRRVLGLAHFDVQLLGAAILLEGRLAEMRTGEGKTLTITAPAAILALEGKGVHVVTANEYLARRDAELMRPVFEALGLTVSAIHSAQTLDEKRASYLCDVTYGVGSEFGFDYLKDHLVRSNAQKVQRGRYAAIVDEIDSVLIDEARVPLIISGPASDRSEMVTQLNSIAQSLVSGKDYIINLKERGADLTNEGYTKVEEYLVKVGVLQNSQDLYGPEFLGWVRQLHSAIKAYALFKRDRDYVVSSGELVLVDIGTGRKMDGRRFDDGLHEALEAKEGLAVQQGTVTKATITYQNYFSQYERLSGLTGTALTDAEEFMDLYSLETVVIPTNRPLARKVSEDKVFRTKSEKFSAVVAQTKALQAKGQPVLVGCASIRDAEVLDKLFSKAGITHETLTAKHIEREAHIIANAGKRNAVTIATNMAGRGTDILLGGERPAESLELSPAALNEQLSQWEAERNSVRELGGLFVLGTERNGIRRVDNQLAGRCGRQGDPGEVQFFLSLEDELLQVFGKSKQLQFLQKAVESGAALKGASISKIVESAQIGFEGQGFSARKNLMKYDSAQSDQRLVVFELRDSLLEQSATAYARTSVLEGVTAWLDRYMPEQDMPEAWNLAELKKGLVTSFGMDVALIGWVGKEELTAEDIRLRILQLAERQLDSLDLTEDHCRGAIFDVLDEAWEDHLGALAELQDNVSLKGFTGLNAIFQFHNDAFELFKSFQLELNHAIASLFLKSGELHARKVAAALKESAKSELSRVAVALETRWVRRNDPCPCASGTPFKLCHGKL